jgi:hypothetical protein
VKFTKPAVPFTRTVQDTYSSLQQASPNTRVMTLAEWQYLVQSAVKTYVKTRPALSIHSNREHQLTVTKLEADSRLTLQLCKTPQVLNQLKSFLGSFNTQISTKCPGFCTHSSLKYPKVNLNRFRSGKGIVPSLYAAVGASTPNTFAIFYDRTAFVRVDMYKAMVRTHKSYGSQSGFSYRKKFRRSDWRRSPSKLGFSGQFKLRWFLRR